MEGKAQIETSASKEWRRRKLSVKLEEEAISGQNQALLTTC